MCTKVDLVVGSGSSHCIVADMDRWVVEVGKCMVSCIVEHYKGYKMAFGCCIGKNLT